MKTIIVLSVLLIGSVQISGQNTISGTINDAEDGPIVFANIILKSVEDSSFIIGTTSDELGQFQIEIDGFENRFLEVSSIGYETSNVELEGNKSEYVIPLSISSNILTQVTVEAKKTLFELKNDRVVVNVGSIPSFGGDNALQVLAKSPGVIVNENGGSISMNNEGEVLIMINNRISRIPRNVLISQLKSIRAENIEKVELIHQPSSKYDSDNSAGIIHIVLKSNSLLGFNGNFSLSAGYGQREKASVSLGLNYRRNRFNIYGDISADRNHSNRKQVNHEREYEFQGGEFGFLNEVVLDNYLNQQVNGNIGLDYNLGENTVLGILAGFNLLNELGKNFTSNSEFFKDNALLSTTKNQFDIDNPKNGQFININLFRKLNHNNSISFDIDRAKFSADNYGYFSSLSENTELESNRVSDFQIWTVKGDYQQNFSSQTSFESGFKATINSTTSKSLLSEKVEGNWNELQDFARIDNVDEVILAAYASVKKQFSDKFEGEFGIRYEQYDYELNALSVQENLDIRLRNPFPIARLNYEIDSIKSINISFNRRTNRPNYGNLVAYQLFLDPTLYVGSNVTLRPAFTNSLRLSYRYKSILTSVEANRTINAISFYNTVDKERGVQTSTPINFDKMESLIANVSFPIYYKSWYECNATLTSGLYRVADASNRPLPFDENILSHNIQVNNTFDFGSGWRANLGGRYLSPFISGDQFQRIGINMDVGISKKFTNGLIVFSIQDLTNTSGIIFWEYHQPELGIRTFGNNNFSERTFRLTYNTTFGDKKLKAKRNRVTGSQEERSRM
jgi:hypothetical protein